MTFEELISALGERIGVDLAAEDGSCVINVDDMVVTLMSLPDTDRLAVHGEIGDPPPEGLEQLLSAMLEANHLFGGTGGATLCQNPETGEYAIFQAFPLAGLNVESLTAAVARIADKTEHWRNILSAFQTAERERGAAAAEEVLLDAIHGGTSGFMRV